LTDEPRFTCPLIKALATRAHCPVMRGMPPDQSVQLEGEGDPNSV
jgi:hypothetical protein